MSLGKLTLPKIEVPEGREWRMVAIFKYADYKNICLPTLMVEQKAYQAMGIHNWTQTGQGTYTRTFCQKNKGPVKAEEGPTKMDSGAIHRTLI
jgi:hypothetical protein